MPTLSDHELRIYSPAGVLVDGGIITGGRGTSSPASRSGFKWVEYSNRVNDVGVCRFALSGSHSVLASLVDKCFVEVRRKNVGWAIPWATEWVGVYRKPHKERRDKVTDFEGTALSLLHVLQWRHVFYDPGLALKSEFTSVAAETVAKRLVNFNIGTAATTTNGRARAGTLSQPSVAIQTDAGGGNVISIAVAKDNLLDAVKKVSRIAGGDFDLVRVDKTTAALQFNWYANQRGTDRTTGSARVLFAPERGTMASSVYEYDVTTEKTVAVVYGQAGDIAVRTGTNYSSTNDIETLVNAGGVTLGNTTALNAAGDIALQQLQARVSFNFQPLQTPNCAYGKHYFLGDRVKARDYGVTVTQKIMGVTVRANSDGSETISLDSQTL